MKKHNFILGMIIMVLLMSCAKKYEEIFDGEQTVQVLIADREFLVPKKYIDNPSLPVQSPLIFDKKGSMIAYFYWPSLAGLAETDTQQRFGNFNHQVVSMQWYIKSERPYINAEKYRLNILEQTEEHNIKKNCKWSDLECIEIIDIDFYEWIGTHGELGSFYIRCPKDRENPVFVLNQVCNLHLDYDKKNIYIASFISSNFIASENDLPNIMLQMKSFLDDWEVVKK